MDTTSNLAMYCDKPNPGLARFLTGVASFLGIFEIKFSALVIMREIWVSPYGLNCWFNLPSRGIVQGEYGRFFG